MLLAFAFDDERGFVALYGADGLMALMVRYQRGGRAKLVAAGAGG